MRLSEVPLSKVQQQLSGKGLVVQTGRFRTRIKSKLKSLSRDLQGLYGDTEYSQNQLVDFDIELKLAEGVRRYLRPHVSFIFNGHSPFTPLPASQYLPLLEWGMNWCVSNHYHQVLIIHAAVVEKHGKAIVLPGQPGSGKSTLCAALVAAGGFRLLSDELTFINLNDGSLIPNPRPLSLKNSSINVIKNLYPEGYYSPVVNDTIKGSVCLLKAPENSIKRDQEPAFPGLVIFPKYLADAGGSLLEPLDAGRAFLELANHSFNYPILAEDGFKALSQHMSNAKAYEFIYDGDLRAAIRTMDTLLRQ